MSYRWYFGEEDNQRRQVKIRLIRKLAKPTLWREIEGRLYDVLIPLWEEEREEMERKPDILYSFEDIVDFAEHYSPYLERHILQIDEILRIVDKPEPPIWSLTEAYIQEHRKGMLKMIRDALFELGGEEAVQRAITMKAIERGKRSKQYISWRV